MTFARIGGNLLHYRVVGPAAAPALVFVNSLGTDARIWDEVIGHLADRYRCLSYDNRGHGLSDAPQGPYCLADHLDDLEGLVGHARIHEAALIGVSIGGLIGQGMALRAPAWLKALVLCDTAAKLGDSTLWATRIAAVSSGGQASIATATMERWFSPAFRSAEPDAVAGWRNMLLRTDPDGYVATCATLRDTDLRAELGRIGLPTLVVAGDADLATPPDLVRDTASAISGARFVVMPGVGHLPSIEAPRQLSGMIETFLKEIGHV